MDCDEEELKATKEKSADEMFEELGYEIEEREQVIIYKRINCKQYFRRKNFIYFDKNRNELKIGERTSDVTTARKLNMQELKAIYKKCEDLGWL